MLVSDLPKDPITVWSKTEPRAIRMAHSIAKGNMGPLNRAIENSGWGGGIVMTLCAVADFINGGYVSYALVPELQKEFGVAEIPDGLSFQDVELPAPSFWVGLPKSTLKIDSGEGLVPAQGIMVIQNQSLRRWMDTTNVGGGDLPRSYELILWGFSSGKDALECTNITESVLVSAETHFGAPRPRPTLGTFLEEELNAPKDPPQIDESVIIANRYILNLLLHLNMPKPWLSSHQLDPQKEIQSLLKKASRAKSERKKRKIRQRASNLPKVQYIVLDAPSRGSSSKVGGLQRKSGERAGHWRRGHYQRYWTGPRKDNKGNSIKGTHCEWKYTPRTWVSGIDKPSTTTKVFTKQAYLGRADP